MTDEEKPGEWEKTFRRRRWLTLSREWIPERIRILFLRVSTRRKIRRLWSEHEAMKQQYVRTHSQAMTHSQAIESEDDYDKSFDDYHKSLDDYNKGLSKLFQSSSAKDAQFQNALDAAGTDWFVARAFKQRVPLPAEENWEDEGIDLRLKPAPLRDFKDAVIKAEREAWKHRREWMAFIFAVLFGVVTAVSVFYNILSTQRKLNDIQGKLNDTQSVLADTQAKLYDAQRKLTDLTEQVRRRELTTGKRRVIPRGR